jgi:heme a synthase
MKNFRLALSAAIAFFFVNIMGFIDTFTVSTEGCGQDYPFCNGKLYPDFTNYHAVIEYIHRLVVLIGMTLLIIVSVVAWKNYRTKKVKILIMFAIGAVFVEAILGALAVYFYSPPPIMAAHIGIALISFAALLNLSFTIREQEQRFTPKRVSKRFVRYSWFCLVYLYLAMYFGAYVASSGDGALFQGAIYPTESYAEVHHVLWVDLAHRGIAVGLVLLAIALLMTAKREGRFKGISIAILFLVLFQGVSGILMVQTHLSLFSILLHVSNVALLFGLMSFIPIQSIGQRAYKN